MTWQLVVTFSVFLLFSATQARYVKSFQGSQNAFTTAMTFFGAGALLFQIGFLIWLGFRVHWYTPILLYCAGLVGMLLLRFPIIRAPDAIISLLGFIAIPISAVLMVLCAK
jgi:hypothetical protein